MRAIILIFALLIPWLPIASQQILGPIVMARHPAAGCTVSAESSTGSSANNQHIGNASSNTYGAAQFTAGASYTLCAIQLSVSKVSSPTGTVTVCIYTNNSGVPGTSISCATPVAASTFSSSAGNITFTGMSASISSGTVYWIVQQASVINASNYSEFWFKAGAVASKSSTNGTAWSTFFGAAGTIFTTYHV